MKKLKNAFSKSDIGKAVTVVEDGKSVHFMEMGYSKQGASYAMAKLGKKLKARGDTQVMHTYRRENEKGLPIIQETEGLNDSCIERIVLERDKVMLVTALHDMKNRRPVWKHWTQMMMNTTKYIS